MHDNKFKNPKLTPTHSKSLCGREGLSEFKCQAPNILFYAGLPTLHKVLDSQLHDTNKRNPNVKTSNNQRLGGVFHDLDPRLSLLWQVGDDVIHPSKICGGCQIRVPRSIHSLNQRCPIQSQLQSVLGVHSYYVEHKNNYT